MKHFLWEKILAMSKFFLYMGCLQVLFATLALAESGKAQVLEQTYVSYDWQNQKLEQAFADIQNQTDFFFTFDRRQIKGISISGFQEQTSLADLLKFISSRTGLMFNISKEIILVKYDTNSNETNRTDPNPQLRIELPAQYSPQSLATATDNKVIYEVSIHEINEDQILRGKVSSEEGNPLVGATVVVKETGQGTVTDNDGNFTIAVPDEGEATLVVSYIGYQTTEVKVSGQAQMDIRLRLALTELDEVVVVGYGTQKKREYTGTVASIPQERLNKVPNLNIAQAIQGAIPGVTVTQNQAGAASSESIIIRGRNSILANNTPLIIVDQIPYNGQLRDINVNDIESIEVLRDASATAIYGSRGANGVVLITTKAGKTGKPTITYDGRYAVQEFDVLPNYMDGAEFYAFKETREPGNVTATEQRNFDNRTFTNWQDLAVRQGSSHQHNLSVAGGTDKLSYYFGGSYLDVKGITLNDDYKRITGRVNLDINITDWIRIGTRTQYTDDDRSGVGLDLSDAGRKNPLTDPFDENGNLTIYPWPEFTDIGNPLEPINYENIDEARQILSNNYLHIDFPFLKGLSYRLNSGIMERFVDISTYRGRNTKVGLESGGSADVEQSQFSTAVLENILDYRHAFGKHNVGITALYSYQKDKATSNLLHTEGFPNDITSFYNAAQAQVIIPEFLFTQTDLISTMLRLNYAFREKYFLTLTGRRDGYSGFGDDNKWGNFATVAGAWILSNERFFPATGTINFLKIRASYGENGNQAVDPYQSIAKFRAANFVDDQTSLPGAVPDNLANPALGWETSRSLNLGLDFGIFNNTIFGSVDYFNTNTEDLLLNRTISPVHGISSIIDNIGETKNTGLEFTLNTAQNIGSAITWNANFNFAYIKNEIVSLGLGENGEVDDVASGLFIGEPITSNFNFQFDGVWQLDEADLAASFNTQPGFIKIRDVNGDGVITAADRTIIGQRDPNYIWGLTNSFGYKNFTLTFFVHGVHDVTKENALFQDASASSGVRRNVILKNWWTPDNPTNDFYANNINAGAQQGFSAPLYQNASFIRFKDITLSYNLPNTWVNKIGLSNVDIYFTGRNLLTITDWQESDPELDAGRGTIPLQKEYLFGIIIKN